MKKLPSDREVDFLISDGQRVKMAIQSCTELADAVMREREMNGLIACLEEFNLDEGIIVTENAWKRSKERSSRYIQRGNGF